MNNQIEILKMRIEPNGNIQWDLDSIVHFTFIVSIKTRSLSTTPGKELEYILVQSLDGIQKAYLGYFLNPYTLHSFGNSLSYEVAQTVFNTKIVEAKRYQGSC